MNARCLTVLGSTGSIGCSTLDVLRRYPGKFAILALAAHSNVVKLAEQCRQFKPRYAGIVDRSRYHELVGLLSDQPVEIVAGESAIIELAAMSENELVVNAIVGAAGLKVSLAAIRVGKKLALANKESLIAGGPLFEPLMKETGGAILPIDSEHSAIWQALMCGKPEEVRTIYLTASGGPFRSLPLDQFENITLQQALNHPTWKMGSKITIDSATLVNKGLEVIEATILFSVPTDKVKVVIHPQSIIHSLVEYQDSSIIAQMSQPDMRLPITYALFWPERMQSDFGRLDPTTLSDLTFEKPDYERFPALGLAYVAAQAGGTTPAVYNAANEIAVAAFLQESIKFTEIPMVIDNALQRIDGVAQPTLEDIMNADTEARTIARTQVKELTCC
jgi:1-deoxy-D-xylulose-5-phosphate reductoisomerase